jgi:putative phosphoesterase
MRVAALYDIHGNLPALEAVLEEVRRAGVDRVVVGGDVVPGPLPRETLACLLNLEMPVQFIHGNGDRVVLAQMRGGDISEVPEQHRDAIRWTARHLQAEYEGVLASWPATCRVEIDGVGEVLFCHATPRNDTEAFSRLTSEDRLLPIFAALNVPLVVCGHTHMQFDRTVGNVRVVNAGSVGCPFGEPGADWLLLGPDVDLRHTSYDLAKAEARIRAAGSPLPPEPLMQFVLHPPSEKDMLEAFTRAELT